MLANERSAEPRTFLRAGRFILIQKLLRRDKTPALLLALAALVGVLTGLIGVAFDRAVNFVIHTRLNMIDSVDGSPWLTGLSAFFLAAVLGGIGYFLVRRYAPEAGGSGIPEIEGALEELRPVRWWRVLPVKFIGGMGALGSGMVLGREGPTVQLGGNIGGMCVDLFRVRAAESRHTLLATGAAAGLSAAFNAPLAGILFILEEMRPQFRYSLISIKAVFVGVIVSSIVFRLCNGNEPIINIGQLRDAPTNTLWLYLILGMLFGGCGVAFNRLIFAAQDQFQRWHKGRVTPWVIGGSLLAGTCGVIGMVLPQAVQGGISLIPDFTSGNVSAQALFFLFALRTLITICCFSSGAPGGIFAPMLTLGTLLGTCYGQLCMQWFPGLQLEPATFAVAGMGALFAASVRAPLTGIVLVLEMTNNYQLILPMIITCLGATLAAQFFGGKPLYSSILARTLAKANRIES
ncbi:H(+)/Cl(-) exchange transporter ClcA [Candidatus Pantoea floridensis]|uniref:Chloride channel protein, CIC family n=1 Tax=Candidatus Pantoea floridensis TaxID=1938870 RepID=A0A286DMQ2_9GAMM|nr:H(+)/Cl(-) exchange transporter ClcA [Pantoea floridensis]PIF14687.1 CIC family chloride channel protein [Enterobacteriaceae bacterium JKS000233]SOD59774.1 chloride channel protein, CIC family [Pantoea floridensis]HBZ15570.1 H(+)/Cl(-) exchange transporter ClcA [Pantoea sp.]